MIPEEDPVAEAITVLTTRGHIVEPDEEFKNWRVDGGDWLTAGDVLVLAICLGLRAGVGRFQ